MRTLLPIAAAALLAVSTASVSTAHAGEFTLTSQDIQEGVPLSDLHVFNDFGCEGQNVSPALAWSDPPEGTKSFVITAYDPDAPTGSGWWHWLAFNIPADVRSLPQGAGAEAGSGMPDGVTQSVTDFGSTGFGGACPPKGEMHRYQFTVHALSVEKLDLGPEINAAVVGYMTRANSLGSTTLTVPYTR